MSTLSIEHNYALFKKIVKSDACLPFGFSVALFASESVLQNKPF
jgi:hypothetical protein